MHGCNFAPHSPSESPARRAAGQRLRAARIPSGTDTDGARRRPLRIRGPVATRLFPDDVASFRCCTSWRMARRPKSPSWATRASSAYRCSWAARPRPAARSCRARATPTGSRPSCSRRSSARFGPTMHLLLRYTQALITQMAQTAVCNRHHSVDQQLCRWLLLSLDRLPSNELSMTQELIANMLGVRREGVTEAAGKLQDAGLITLPPRQDHRARSPGPRGAVLRVLPGRQDGVRSPPAVRAR